MEYGIAAGVGLASNVLNKPDTTGAKMTQSDNAARQRFIEQQAYKAQNTANDLFSDQFRNLTAGNMAAGDVYKRAMPAQMSSYLSGVGASEQALMGGQQQVYNALMGLPVNFGAMTAQPRQHSDPLANYNLRQVPFVMSDVGDPTQDERRKSARQEWRDVAKARLGL